MLMYWIILLEFEANYKTSKKNVLDFDVPNISVMFRETYSNKQHSSSI